MHPLDATSFDQLDPDYLIDYKSARLVVPRGARHHDVELCARMEAVKDRDSLKNALLCTQPALAPPPDHASDDSLAQWESSAISRLRAAVAGRPFTADQPLESQISASVDTLLRALVVARRGREKLAGTLAPPSLPLAPRPIPGRPALGGGSIDFFEFTDIVAAGCTETHLTLRERLAPALPHIRWHIIHAPTGFHPRADPTAAMIELLARRDPGRYWEVVTCVNRNQRMLEVGSVSSLLLDLDLDIDDEDLEEEADAFVAAGGLTLDRRVANACAVPDNWPRYAIGRRLFVGTRQADDILAEIEALRSGPADSPSESAEDAPVNPLDLSWAELMQTRFPSLDMRLGLVPMLAGARATRDLAMLMSEALAALGVPATRPYIQAAVASLHAPPLSDPQAVESAAWLVNLAEVAGIGVQPIPQTWLDTLSYRAGDDESIAWTLTAFRDTSRALPAWPRFLRRFPADLGAGPFLWPHIFCIGRAALSRRGDLPPGEVAATIHRQILHLAG